MRKLTLILAFGATLGLMAQEGQKWGTAQVGFTGFDNRSNLKHTYGAGLGVGMWTDNYLGLDLRGIYQPLKHDDGRKSKEAHALISLLFNLRPGADNWYPYISIGPGLTRAGRNLSGTGEIEHAFNYHAGLGLMGKITQNMLLQADTQLVRVDLPSAGQDRTELITTLGVGYTWGGGRTVNVMPAPAPAPAPAPMPEPAPAPAPAPEPPPAPAPVPEPVVVKPAPAPEPIKIVLDEATLHFQNGKADLSPKAVEAIKRVAASIQTYKGEYTLKVSGHTSSVGSLALNKSLSKRRAEAVAKVLVDNGVKATAVTTEGCGPDKPVADNTTKAGQTRNRRVEIDVNLLGAQAEIRKHEVGLEEAAPAAPKPAPKAKVKAKK